MQKSVVIVAGGAGLRMGSEVPKQFIIIGTRPILMHTITAFYEYDEDINIVLVLPQSQFVYWDELCQKHNFTIKHKVVMGGDSRFQSVKNGLNTIENTTNGLVAIHDGVRPFIDNDIIENSFQAAEKYGNGIVAVKLKDSIRIEQENGSNKAFDRSKCHLIQTPQTFKVALIQKAFQQQESDLFTDDATVLEGIGEQIHLVEGSYKNIKITTKEDLLIARAFLETHSPLL